MHGCGHLLSRLFFLLFGLVFVALGIGLGVFGTRAAGEAAARAERLTPLTAQAIDDGVAGREALIEGVLDQRNLPRFRNFVAYTTLEYQGRDSNDRPDWAEIERVTPPLLISIAGRPVQLANNDYQLEGSLVEWQDSATLTAKTLTSQGTRSYRGLEAGAAVTAIGTLVQGQEGMALRAELVFNGSRDAYIASQRELTTTLLLVGAIFGGVGLVFAVVGLVVFLRG